MSENSPSTPSTPSAPSGPNYGKTAGERILAGIGDDFDLEDSGTEEGSEPTQGGKPKPKPKAKKPDRPEGTSLDESDFDDEAPTEATNTPRPPDDEPEPRAPREPAADDEPEAPQFGPKDRGTRDKPMTFKDLPEDRFIRINIDGKAETISLREAVKGHIRKETFDRTYSIVQHNADKALGLATRALKFRETLQGQLEQFLTTPREMLDFCMKYNPKAADEFARIYATEYLAKWRAEPGARDRWEAERQRARNQEQHEANQKQQRDWERQRAVTEQTEAKKKLLAPGYHEGLKRAGFPRVTPEFQDMLKAVLAQVGKRGPLTPELVRDAVVRVAALLKAPTVQERRPAPIPNAPREVARIPAKPNGKGADWTQVPYAQRVRDPNFFLRR